MENLAPKDSLPRLGLVQDAGGLQILGQPEDDAVAALGGEDVDRHGQKFGVLGDVGEEGGLADYMNYAGLGIAGRIWGLGTGVRVMGMGRIRTREHAVRAFGEDGESAGAETGGDGGRAGREGRGER